MIKRLLYDDKYTIEGARQRLKQLRNVDEPQLSLFFKEIKQEELLREMQQALVDLLEILDDHRGTLEQST